MSKKSHLEYHKKESNFASGLLWGAILGVAGMFLFGTKKGKKLKDQLSKHGSKVLEELEVIYEETELKELPKKITKKVKQTASKKAQEDEGAQDLNHIAKLQKRGRKAAKKFFTRKGKTLK